MTHDWLIVETLSADKRAVIADGGKIKDWANIARARSYGAAASARMVALVDACVASGSEQRELLTLRNSQTALIHAVPVLATFDVVNAVHLWIGPGDVDPPARRSVAAWHFDVDEELNYQGQGDASVEAILRVPEEQRRTVRAAQDNFQNIMRFDDRLGYVEIVSNIELGKSWQGSIVMSAFDGRVHHLQMVARADPHARVARGLFHDISDVSPPEPVVDNAALRLLAASSGQGTGAIDLNTAVIYDWFSKPTAPLDKWQYVSPEIEPTDHELLAAACKRLETSSERESLTIRVRFDDTDWITTDVLITAINKDRAPQGLIQVTPR